MKSKILIIDDLADNRKLLGSILSKNIDCEIIMAKSGIDVIDMFNSDNYELPDLILLDIMMPKMSGFDVASKLKDKNEFKDIPIIFITGLSDTENMVKAFNMGGIDFISKPYNKNELLARVNNHLKIKKIIKELELKNSMLKDKEKLLMHLVEEKTKKLSGLILTIVNALENVDLYINTDTGDHIKRISEYSKIIAEGYGCDLDFINKIQVYSLLHDVGKVGIPDILVKKKGVYNEDEFERMKEHVVIGNKMLDNAEVDPMAKNIALYHHEKWNGSGYVNGLVGEDIPLEARIVAIADVYDALGTKKSYRDAFLEDKINLIIRESSGTHFDPRIVDVFFNCKDKIIEVKKKY